MAVATANATKLNKCACTDALGNFNLEDADLFAPRASVIQDKTYLDGLGRAVTVRSISPVTPRAAIIQDKTYISDLGSAVTVRSISPIQPSSPVRIIKTEPLMGTQQINILNQQKSNLGLGNALDASGVKVLGTVRTTRTLSPVIKRTVTKQVTQPSEEYYQLGSTTRDARFADKMISVGGKRPTSVVTVTEETTTTPAARKVYVFREDQDQAPPQAKRGLMDDK